MADQAPELEYLEPKVDVLRRDDGSIILSSPHPLNPVKRQLGDYMRYWANATPDQAFLAQRDEQAPGRGWRELTFGTARAQADAIGQGLLDRGLGPDRPLMILSPNSLRHGALTYGAMQVGIPVAPVSPAYCLMSQDYSKLRHIFDLVRPAMIFVEDPAPFANALDSLDLSAVELLDGGDGFDGLLATTPGDGMEAAYAKVGPDTVAKYLFTSGSTGMPKGVINTQGMLCANMAQL
ncbi:MAG: AMP-binding protein, partial [Rhodospirillaceae bacterium]|nr:AMP-binding protein [Rhodospirillaceae bacterium]